MTCRSGLGAGAAGAPPSGACRGGCVIPPPRLLLDLYLAAHTEHAAHSPLFCSCLKEKLVGCNRFPYSISSSCKSFISPGLLIQIFNLSHLGRRGQSITSSKCACVMELIQDQPGQPVKTLSQKRNFKGWLYCSVIECMPDVQTVHHSGNHPSISCRSGGAGLEGHDREYCFPLGLTLFQIILWCF